MLRLLSLLKLYRISDEEISNLLIKSNTEAQEKKISVKAALSVPPNYLLKGKNKGMDSKLRIVSDACFR